MNNTIMWNDNEYSISLNKLGENVCINVRKLAKNSKAKVKRINNKSTILEKLHAFFEGVYFNCISIS